MREENRDITKNINVLVFKAGDRCFSFKSKDVREIVHMAELVVPPGLPSFIEGFLHMEGDSIPVLSLSQLFFSSPIVKRLYTPLIILEPPAGAWAWAVVVDAVLEIASLAEEELLPVQEENVFNNCVTAVSEIHGQQVYLLDPGRILLEQEKERLNQFREIARQRLAKTETKTKTKTKPKTKRKTNAK